MNELQDIDFYDLIQRRKEMQKNTSEYEQIDKQIKDAEWLFMKTIFYLVDCLDKTNVLEKDEKLDIYFLVDVFSPIFENPSSDNFKKINRILNQKNMKDMLNEFFYFRFEVMSIPTYLSNYLNFNLSFDIDNFKVNGFNKLVQEMFTSRNPETYIQSLKESENEKYILMLEEFKEKYLEFWNTEIEKISYINDCFPQITQRSYYLSNKGKNINEMSRNINFKKFSIIYNSVIKGNFLVYDTLSIKEETSKRKILEKKYTKDNIEQTFSLFEFINSEHEYFEDFYYATNYLESRFITCHFDGTFFESNEQPDELTRKFYMKIWLEKSIILQNLMRFHLNSNSPIYNKAREKFRSDEFKNYALENPKKINDLLFAFIFTPNEFADCNDYEQLISDIKISKYYSAVMRIDKYMFKNYLDYKPYVYFKNMSSPTKIFYSLVKFFSKINPTEKNKIDKLLLNNRLLIEIAINHDNSKFDYIANLNSSNFNYHTKQRNYIGYTEYAKSLIAKGICLLIITISKHNFSQEQKDFLQNYLNELDLEKLNFIASVFQQYPEELDNIVDFISNDIVNNQKTFDAYDSMKKCEYKILKKREETKRSKMFLVISPIAFIIAAAAFALLISLFFPPFALLGLKILSCIGAGLILTTGAGIAFGWLFLNEYSQTRKNLQDLSEDKSFTEKAESSKINQTGEIPEYSSEIDNNYDYSDNSRE